MTGTSLAKATILNLDKGGSPVECMFNPKEYTFSKENKWSEAKNAGANVPAIEFGGGQPATLQLQLFFDTYASGKDVRKQHTNAIWQLMMVDPDLKDPKNKKGRPPTVRFQWGSTWSFDAVLTSIKQAFTLFLPDGTPVRATLDVGFTQVKDVGLFPPQNPSSGGRGGERLWTVREGDTLAWIAYREYGDCGQWRLIADANRLDSVRRLISGSTLVIPNG